MKKISFYFILLLSLGFSGCSSQLSNGLAHSQPIINFTAQVAPLIQVTATTQQAVIKNLTQNTINLTYQLTWYDRNGVTQLANWQQPSNWQQLQLLPQQNVILPLAKPTPTSVNYRLFIRKE